MTLEAHRCPDGHLTYPAHARCPTCGHPQTDTVDLTEHTATLLTWTTSTAPPPGVREPNHLGIVAFDLETDTVQVLGQLTTGDVAIGDELHPVYEEQLRDPEAGIREPTSQEWDGYRFAPVTDD